MDANRELIEALDQLEKEKDIKKDVILEALENSLVAACKNNFGRADNIKVYIDRETGVVNVYAMKKVVEEVTDPVTQISLEEARKKDIALNVGDTINIEVTPKNFGRIAAQKAKQVVVQKSVKKKEECFTSSLLQRKETS
jgi:NusA N-terminal domain.